MSWEAKPVELVTLVALSFAVAVGCGGATAGWFWLTRDREPPAAVREAEARLRAERMRLRQLSEEGLPPVPGAPVPRRVPPAQVDDVVLGEPVMHKRPVREPIHRPAARTPARGPHRYPPAAERDTVPMRRAGWPRPYATRQPDSETINPLDYELASEDEIATGRLPGPSTIVPHDARTIVAFPDDDCLTEQPTESFDASPSRRGNTAPSGGGLSRPRLAGKRRLSDYVPWSDQ